MCNVRNTAWHLVSEAGAREAGRRLFDMKNDYGERQDVAVCPGPFPVEDIGQSAESLYPQWGAFPIASGEPLSSWRLSVTLAPLARLKRMNCV